MQNRQTLATARQSQPVCVYYQYISSVLKRLCYRFNFRPRRTVYVMCFTVIALI